MNAGSIFDSPEIPVRYVAGDPAQPITEQAPTAFEQLEALFDGALSRARFYGVVLDGEYRACVATRSADVAGLADLPLYTVPGGRYFCRRLSGVHEDPSQIGLVAEELLSRSDYDASRPVVEYYRSHREIVVRVPVH